MTKKTSLPFFVFLAGAIIMAVCLLIIKNTPLLVDEYRHYQTIKDIISLNLNLDTFQINPQLPGYYLLMGLLGYLGGFSSLLAMRITTTVFSFFSMLVFYFLAKKISPQEAILKTSQYFFFPLIFVFFFLVYNDIFSLLLLMVSFLLVLNKRYLTAGLVGLLSVLVRQNNIIWLGFFCLFIFFQEDNFTFSKESLKRYLKDISFFILSVFAIVIFVITNHGPAIAEPTINPLAFHLENFFFWLFLAFFFFLPEIILNLPKIAKFLKKYPYCLGLVGFIFVVYLIFFKADHWYNNSLYFNFFLRNKLVNYAVENLTQKTIFFLPIAFSLISLPFFSFYKKSFYLLYPFTFIFLSLLWLIEPRYAITPFAFLLLFKKGQSQLVESITLAIYIVMSAWIFWGTFTQNFFL